MNLLALIPAVLQVLAAVDGKVALGDVVKDISTVYPVYSAGKVDVAGMIKAGTLEPTMAAVARLSNLADTMLKDNDSAGAVQSLLQSVTS